MNSRLARTVFALVAGGLGQLVLEAKPVSAQSSTTETIVLLRHGEKPSTGLGQLSCQGLNRALALPSVLMKAYGKPAAIYAPNPSEQKPDNGILYDYIRPLATIEPTAVALGMPIHTGIGQSKIDVLRHELNAPAYHDATVLVAWEHYEAMQLARALLKQFGGDPTTVPDWKSADFDSLYVVKIHRSGASATASFELDHEGLDGMKTTCPGAPG